LKQRVSAMLCGCYLLPLREYAGTTPQMVNVAHVWRSHEITKMTGSESGNSSFASTEEKYDKQH
jgi:hypothetical protein